MAKDKGLRELAAISLSGLGSTALGTILSQSGPVLTLNVFWAWIGLFLGGVLLGSTWDWYVIAELDEDRATIWGIVWFGGITGIVPLALMYNAYISAVSGGVNPIITWGAGFAAGVFVASLYAASGILKELLQT